jgi:hypothetical protein
MDLILTRNKLMKEGLALLIHKNNNNSKCQYFFTITQCEFLVPTWPSGFFFPFLNLSKISNSKKKKKSRIFANSQFFIYAFMVNKNIDNNNNKNNKN